MTSGKENILKQNIKSKDQKASRNTLNFKSSA